MAISLTHFQSHPKPPFSEKKCVDLPQSAALHPSPTCALCYDESMNALERETQYIRKWRPIAIKGDMAAMSNVAAAYRIIENFKLSARWHKKAAEKGNGDDMVDWGYCLQHVIGVRKDEKAAERAYRSAIAFECITEYGREDAMYQLAVLLLNQHSAASRRAAKRLLRRANKDGDYPEAEALLQLIENGEVQNVCICRRHLRPRLAKRHCPRHGPRRAMARG